MEQVVLKPHNLPEQSRISACDLPVQGEPCLSDLFEQAYQNDLLPWKILEAMRRKDSLEEITVAECVEHNGPVLYGG